MRKNIKQLAATILLSCLTSVSIASDVYSVQAQVSPEKASELPRVIKVGVRADAQPFSYLSSARREEPILESYGGYMVEVCRRVLTEMTKSGMFSNYSVKVVKIDAGNRFKGLNDGVIDILCGPASITFGRLRTYNSSHPLFLSGVTYVSAGKSLYPKHTYCNAVLGLVQNTTAETEGIRSIAKSNVLLRFDEPLEQFLSATVSSNTESLLKSFENFKLAYSHVITGSVESDAAREREKLNRVKGRNPVDPASIRTTECKSGYTAGPIVYYDNHDVGLNDLCSGKILHYVGDKDIISRKISEIQGCDYILNGETLTKEAYGVYFRRPSRNNLNGIDDGALYAEFNNVLLKKMQSVENILDYEYLREFGNEQKSKDLQQFFDSFKFASNY